MLLVPMLLLLSLGGPGDAVNDVDHRVVVVVVVVIVFGWCRWSR